LADLYRQHGHTVLGLCRLLLRDPAEAEDAAQQTFLSAYRSLLAGNQPEHPAAWLATIARNECWGRIQRRMRQPVPEQLAEELASPLPEPLEAAVRRGELSALFAAIAALPPAQRNALLLREFSGLSYEQLGEALSVSEPAVESLLVRARRELRARLRRVFTASVTPLFLPREWLSRLGEGGESSLGVASKLGSVAVATKVAAGAATLTVVGGSIMADGRELARPSAEAARPPARQQATTEGSRAPPAAPRSSDGVEARAERRGGGGGHDDRGRGSDASREDGGSSGPGSGDRSDDTDRGDGDGGSSNSGPGSGDVRERSGSSSNSGQGGDGGSGGDSGSGGGSGSSGESSGGSGSSGSG
jgi:RNA polymerase sigma factor (sigma-70 family)